MGWDWVYEGKNIPRSNSALSVWQLLSNEPDFQVPLCTVP
jgi:hypothetical protein